MAATTPLLRRIRRLEAQVPSREPNQQEIISRAVKRLSIDEKRTIVAARNARRNGTNELTEEQAKALARVRALVDEEQAKWIANGPQPSETTRRSAADDDDDDAEWRASQNRLRSELLRER
jgi:hypothetical protein